MGDGGYPTAWDLNGLIWGWDWEAKVTGVSGERRGTK